MTEELARSDRQGVVNFEDYAMPIESIIKQVDLIKDVMKRVMTDGEHYGVIPGTKKPTLLKPGAEKLGVVFRLEPDYEIVREIREDTFISYTIKCTLTHIPTGQKIASGVGSCNSREEKYRWRYDESATDKQVPKAYWDARKAGDTKEMERLIGKGMRTIKVDGIWWVANATKVPNDNPWDLDNTIMKMACKRALVAATLNATAASDIFTQDIEDLPEGTIKPENGKPQQTESEKRPPVTEADDPSKHPISEAQKKKVFVQLDKLKVPEDSRHGYISLVLGLETCIESLNGLNVKQASTLIETLNTKIKEAEGA